MSNAVITGGAGFIGTHLTQRLLAEGYQVTIIDDLSTGRYENIPHGAEFIRSDVRDIGWLDWMPSDIEVIWHLASPCSPADYTIRPSETLSINSEGTEIALRAAATRDARFVLASTSEIYGDPAVHPQHEWYTGNVNTRGSRACYDEGKRYAEALTEAYAAEFGVETKIARIFNTYGPLMPDDGRVIIRFLAKALMDENLRVTGDGKQTRSFSFISDTIDALWKFYMSTQPVMNIGNDDEISVFQLALKVIERTGSRSRIEYAPGEPGDPQRRQPDLMLLKSTGWEPRFPLSDGLKITANWMFDVMNEERQKAVTRG